MTVVMYAPMTSYELHFLLTLWPHWPCDWPRKKSLGSTKCCLW